MNTVTAGDPITNPITIPTTTGFPNADTTPAMKKKGGEIYAKNALDTRGRNTGRETKTEHNRDKDHSEGQEQERDRTPDRNQIPQ